MALIKTQQQQGIRGGRRRRRSILRRPSVLAALALFSAALCYYYYHVHHQLVLPFDTQQLLLFLPTNNARKEEEGINSNQKGTAPSLDPSLARSVLLQPIRLDRCKVHRPPPTAPSSISSYSHSPHTVVTAYFRAKSKYGADRYDGWMENMLSIRDPVVIFTSPDMVESILRLRRHHLNSTVVVAMDLADLPIAQLTGRRRMSGSNNNSSASAFWQDQLDSKDQERRRHQSYQVFWIWLSKTWWVMQAIEHFNHFGSEFFVWSDIGCFRNKAYNDKVVVRYPDMVPPNTLLWEAHHRPDPPPTGPIFWDKLGQRRHFYHSGSQGAGKVPAWRAFHEQFATTMDEFLDADYFVGEDQCVLQAACLQSPQLCAYVPFDQVRDNHYFGLRYVLHHGPGSAKTDTGEYRLWRPPGWDQ